VASFKLLGFYEKAIVLRPLNIFVPFLICKSLLLYCWLLAYFVT